MKKMLFLFFMVLSLEAHTQTKKEQIKTLTNYVDSLNRMLSYLNVEIIQVKDHISEFKAKSQILSNQIVPTKDSLISIKNLNLQLKDKIKKVENKAFENDLHDYIRDFYSSLELSGTEDNIAYENKSPFTKTAYKDFLSTTRSYSTKRVKFLTGTEHYYHHIALLEIANISYQDTLIIVQTKTEYYIQFEGSFHNTEELQLIFHPNKFEIYAWYDVKTKGNELFFSNAGRTRKELLNMVGSNPK